MTYSLLHKFRDTFFRASRRYDLSPWDHEPPAGGKPIYGIYHVYCAGPWRQMVAEQMASLRSSGLLDATRRFYVSCIPMEPGDSAELERIIGTEKAVMAAVTPPPGHFEYPALRIARQLGTEEDCLIYYFHTKGVSYYPTNSQPSGYRQKFLRNVTSWRLMMEWTIFEKWQVAVNALSDGYDTYGCYRLPPPPMKYYLYGGNFWWARGSYLAALPPITDDDLKERYYAEEWLYKGGPKDFSAFDTMADLYYVNMPRCLYAAPRTPLLTAIAFSLRYNLHKFRKHVLHYDFNEKYKFAYHNEKPKQA